MASERKKNRHNSTAGVFIVVFIFIIAICIWGYARFAPTATTQTVLQGEHSTQVMLTTEKAHR